MRKVFERRDEVGIVRVVIYLEYILKSEASCITKYELEDVVVTINLSTKTSLKMIFQF